jgi:outer membrane protein assembly factor BamB
MRSMQIPAMSDERWSREFPDVVRFSTLGINDDVVIALTLSALFDSTLTALDARTGTSIWQVTFPGANWSSAVVDDGTVVVQLGSFIDHLRDIAAFDIMSGTETWDLQDTTSVLLAAEGGWLALGNPPDGGSERALVPDGSAETISVVEIETGREAWRSPVRAQIGRATIVANVVVVATWEGNEGPGFVQAFDLASGAEQWCHETIGAPDTLLPASDRVLTFEADDTVHVYDAVTGQERLRGSGISVSRPLYGERGIAVGSGIIVAAGTAFSSSSEIQPQTVIGYGAVEGDAVDSEAGG